MKKPFFSLSMPQKNCFLILFIATLISFYPVAGFGGDLPEGPDVQIGDPTITTEGNEMLIDAGSHSKTWIDWTGGFNIGVQNLVNNLGPSRAAAILHNDISGNISNIQGVLNGNCNVFLLNANGILFSSTAQVNVGSLVASSLNMSQQDFLDGNYVLTADGQTLGTVVNQGTISALEDGSITLAGGAVKNLGTIDVNLGTVNLVSGSQITLDVIGNGNIQAAVSQGLLDNVYDQDGNKVEVGVENIGEITADGGKIYMEADAISGVFDTLVNQEGIVRAGSLVEQNGKIVLRSDSEGIVQNTGTITASAVEEGASGGTVEMSGDLVGQFGTVSADGAGEASGGNIDIYAEGTVALSADSLTTANAGTVGDGGEIIVFSPDTALFWPEALIEAKGGSISGDGGFVEVSGREHVEVYGTVSTLAPNGENGWFLIDPRNVIITGVDSNGGWSGGNTGTWTPTGDDSVANVDTALANGNTIVTTNDAAGVQAGNITVTSVVTASANANDLTLQAANDIILNAGINMSAGTGNLTLTADWGGGDVASDNNGNITDGGGSITMGTGDLAISAGDGIGTSTDPIATVALTDVAATTNSGGIYISNSGSGNVNITTVDGITGVTATAGDIELINSAGGILLTEEVSAAGSTVTLDASGAITDDADVDNDVTAATLNMTATGGIGSALCIETTVDTLDVINNNVIGSTSQIQVSNAAVLQLDGAVNNDGGDLTIWVNDNALTVAGDVTATGSGAINLDVGTNTDAATTINDNVNITAGTGDINLTGRENISLGAGVLLQTGGDGVIDIDAAGTIPGDDDFTMNATAQLRTTGTGAVTVDAGNDLTITNIDSAGAITIDSNGGGTITLNGNVGNTNGVVTFSDSVSVSGNSTVSSTNSDVTFGVAVLDSIDNTHTLTVNANNGTATFTGAVGDGVTDLSSLTVTAGDTLFSSTTQIGTGGLTVTGVGTSTTTISGDVTSDSDVLYDDSVILGNDADDTITITTSDDSVEITGKIDGTTANTESLDIEAGSGAVTLGDSIGTTTTLATLQIDTTGQTELNGAIRVGTDLDLDQADDVQLGSDLTATVGNDAILDVIDGAFALNIDAGNDITLYDSIGATENLASVTMTADDELNISGAITSTGEVNLTANGTVGGEDLNLGANVIGTNVILTASNQNVIVTATQNNTSGSTTYNGTTTINGGAITLTSDSNMTFNDAVTVTAIADGGITSTNGNLDFNSSILDGGSTESLNLNAASGDIALQVISGTLAEVDLDSLTAELGGATIDVGHFDTAGVGLTTLVADVDIDATAAAGINLGDLDGAHSLTLSASDGSGLITLADADIQALTIDDGFTTSFTGDFVTSGNVAVSGVTGEIDVASAGSINAGGAVTLANTDAGATGIDINGAVTGTGGVTMTATTNNVAIDADVSTSGDGLIDIDATAGNVNIAQAAAASVTGVNGEIEIDGTTINLANAGNVGTIVTTGTGPIDINGNLVMDDEGATKISGGGGVDVSGTATITGEVVGTNSDVDLHGAVTLAENTTVASANGNVTYYSTIDGNYNLTVNADNGTVNMDGAVGGGTGLAGLQITALNFDLDAVITDAGSVDITATSNFGGDITATAGAITITGDSIISGAARTLTATTDIDVNGDISGVQDLTLAGTNNVMIQDIGIAGGDPTLLDVNTTAAQLEGDIIVDGNVRFDGATTTTVASDVNINTTGGADGTVVDFAALDGSNSLTIAGGDADVSFAGTTQLTGLTVSSSDTVDFTGIVSIPGSIDITAAEAAVDTIDVAATIDSTAGSVTLNGITELNATVDAGQNVILNGATTITTDMTITADAGYIDINAAIDDDAVNTDDLTLIAPTGTVYCQAIGTSTGIDALDINSDAAELNGNIVANSVALDGVGLTTLTAGTVDIDTTSGTLVNLGALDGANNLTISAATTVTLADADIASLDIDDATDVSFAGDFVTSGVVTVDTAITGEIDVASAGSIQAGGAATLTTASDIDINGSVTADGVIAMTADDIFVDANITGTGSNNIALTAGGDILVAGTATATISTAGDITLTADEDVTVGSGAPVAGKIITTGTGVITIRADENADDTGDLTIIGTGSKIQAAEDVNVTHAFDVNIGGDGVFADNGDISITGIVNDINISTIVKTLSGGDITLTAGENVLFDNAAAVVRTTDEGNIDITATSGSILETVDNSGVDIAGYQITLSALNSNVGQDVGATGTLDEALEIDSRNWISATTATGNGDIWLAETLGAMNINQVTTGSNSSGTVTLEARDTTASGENGRIENAGVADTQVTAGSLRMDAERGIGVADPLTTDVGTLAAQTNEGGIYLENINDLIIGTVNTREGVKILDPSDVNDGDSIVITSTGSAITVNDVVTNNDGGDITLAAEGDTETDDMTIAAAITASGGNGDIFLYAGHDVLQTTADVTAAGSGAINVYAGVDYNSGTPQAGHATADITQSDGQTISSTSGDITMTATENVNLSHLSTGGNVSITADDDTYSLSDNSGAITDNPDDDTVNITAATATLRAATGIGSADDIETIITTLDALNTTSGNIQIYELAVGTDLDINQATQQTAGNIDIQTENGTLTVVADQSGVTAVDSGTVTLVAGDSDISYEEDLVINDGVTSASGNITLTSSGDDVTFGAGGDVTSTSGNVDVNAESDDSGGSGVITMADGAVIDSGTGQIDMDAYGDITLGGLTTTYTADDAVAVTSAAGGIVDGGDTDVDIVANTATATADLDAVTGIGTDNALETSIYNLEANNGTTSATSSNIKINETDDINLVSVINKATGSIDVEAAGTITISIVTAEAGAVHLYATAGDIVDNTTGTTLITAGSTSSLKASGVIGSAVGPHDPIDVDIDGELWVWTAGAEDGVSAILQGTVNTAASTERVEIYEPSPPGLVIFDNHLMGGGNYGSGSTGGSILSQGYGETTVVLTTMFDVSPQSTLEGWGHNFTSRATLINESLLTGPSAEIDASELGITGIPTNLLIPITPSFGANINSYYIIRAP